MIVSQRVGYISRLSDISDSILLVEQQLPPELIKALYGHMDVLVGTRMHSVSLPCLKVCL